MSSSIGNFVSEQLSEKPIHRGKLEVWSGRLYEDEIKFLSEIGDGKVVIGLRKLIELGKQIREDVGEDIFN